MRGRFARQFRLKVLNQSGSGERGAFDFLWEKLLSNEFCPTCFAEVAPKLHRCPSCGGTLREAWQRGSYDERLMRALRHPVPEVRMGAIIALQKRGTTAACAALEALALKAPSDLPQGMAVVQCLCSMLPAREARDGLERIAAQHGARSIRKRARNALTVRKTPGTRQAQS